MTFENIPHSQRLMDVVSRLEAGDGVASVEQVKSVDADMQQTMNALKEENSALKERQQKIIQRIDRLINTLEKAV